MEIAKHWKNSNRREIASNIGGELALDPTTTKSDLLKKSQASCYPYGPDTCIEVCGVPEAMLDSSTHEVMRAAVVPLI